jgi:hypothetical protein
LFPLQELLLLLQLLSMALLQLLDLVLLPLQHGSDITATAGISLELIFSAALKDPCRVSNSRHLLNISHVLFLPLLLLLLRNSSSSHSRCCLRLYCCLQVPDHRGSPNPSGFFQRGMAPPVSYQQVSTSLLNQHSHLQQQQHEQSGSSIMSASWHFLSS